MAAVFHQLKFVHRFISAEKLPLVQFSTKYENVKRGKGKGRNLPPVRKRRRLPFTRIALSRYTEEKEKNVSDDPSEIAMLYSQPRPFDPYIINIPFRMGRPKPGETPSLAITTPEILKIPNFFHLTPPIIQKQCEALKRLCTPWPENLPPLPITISTRNFVFPSHDIKHPESRIVKLRFSLKDLSLTDHARDKMVQLAGKRYDEETDTITIVGKKCPTRKQNKEYVLYLLKVLYLESNKIEPWENLQD